MTAPIPDNCALQGKRVVCLEYEAYEPMAVKKLGELCGQVRAKWPDVHNVALHHRVGVVGPAEASVVIAVTRYMLTLTTFM